MCSLTFAVLTCSVIAWSDTPYLSLSLLVLLMVFNIMERKTSVHWSYIVLTGILSGFAFLFRYVGISLIASIGVCLIVATIIRMITIERFSSYGGALGSWLCLPIVPYLYPKSGRVRSIGVIPSSDTNEAIFFSNVNLVVRLYLQGLSTIIFGTSSLAWVIFILIIMFYFMVFLRLEGFDEVSLLRNLCSLVLLGMYFFIYSFF